MNKHIRIALAVSVMIVAGLQNTHAQTTSTSTNNSIQTDPGFANAQNNVNGDSGVTVGGVPCTAGSTGCNSSTGIGSQNSNSLSGMNQNTVNGNVGTSTSSTTGTGALPTNQAISPTGISPNSATTGTMGGTAAGGAAGTAGTGAAGGGGRR